MSMLNWQFYMQVFQFIGFWIWNLVDWTGVDSILTGPTREKGALAYTAILVMMAIVPFLSFTHYSWYAYSVSALTDDKNKIKVWLMVFPIIGLILFLQFLFEILLISQAFMGQLEGDREAKSELYDEKTLLNDVNTKSRKLITDDRDDDTEPEACCQYICCYKRESSASKANQTMPDETDKDEHAGELALNVCESAAIFKTTRPKRYGCFKGRAGRLQKKAINDKHYTW